MAGESDFAESASETNEGSIETRAEHSEDTATDDTGSLTEESTAEEVHTLTAERIEHIISYLHGPPWRMGRALSAYREKFLELPEDTQMKFREDLQIISNELDQYSELKEKLTTSTETSDKIETQAQIQYLGAQVQDKFFRLLLPLKQAENKLIMDNRTERFKSAVVRVEREILLVDLCRYFIGWIGGFAAYFADTLDAQLQGSTEKKKMAKERFQKSRPRLKPRVVKTVNRPLLNAINKRAADLPNVLQSDEKKEQLTLTEQSRKAAEVIVEQAKKASGMQMAYNEAYEHLLQSKDERARKALKRVDVLAEEWYDLFTKMERFKKFFEENKPNKDTTKDQMLKLQDYIKIYNKIQERAGELLHHIRVNLNPYLPKKQ